MYMNSCKEINDKDSKFKIGGIVKISNYKKNFAKVHVPNWSEEILLLQKFKKLFHGHMLLVGKELHKTNQDAFRVEKVIKRIGNNRLNGMAILVLLTVGVTKKI